MMDTTEIVGCLAVGLVLAASCMRRMASLRATAVCSNLAFMAYATQLDLLPILLLHATLLPVNLWRLAQLKGLARGAAGARERWWRPRIWRVEAEAPAPSGDAFGGLRPA